jgi:hypothetical protein
VNETTCCHKLSEVYLRESITDRRRWYVESVHPIILRERLMALRDRRKRVVTDLDHLIDTVIMGNEESRVFAR